MRLFLVAVLSAVPFSIAQARADDHTEGRNSGNCVRVKTPLEVVNCARDLHPEVRLARQQLDVLAGRRLDAGIWLPSNPVVTMGFGRRHATIGDAPPTDHNWSITLLQEIEIGGQRSARLEYVDAEAMVHLRNIAVVEQEGAAEALQAYFEVLAAAERVALTDELARLADGLSERAGASEQARLMSGLDADVARAEALRLHLLHIESGKQLEGARRVLSLLLGVDPQVMEVDGSLAMDQLGLPEVNASYPELEARALKLRGEVAAAQMEQNVLRHRLKLLKRERMPNVTVSAFAQRDGFGERVFGAGFSVPLLLPSSIGRTKGSAIAEVTARIESAGLTVDQVQHRVRVEVARADADHKKQQRALSLFPPELVAKARTHLASIGEAVTARQMSMREALAAQRALIELLQSNLEVRLASAQAWVELCRVTGMPFEGAHGAVK